MSKFQKSLSFTGRSEIIRASVRSGLSEEKEKEDLIGDVHVIYVVAHDEKSDNEITEIGYAYGKLINTPLQNKIDKDTFLHYLCSKEIHLIIQLLILDHFYYYIGSNGKMSRTSKYIAFMNRQKVGGIEITKIYCLFIVFASVSIQNSSIR